MATLSKIETHKAKEAPKKDLGSPAKSDQPRSIAIAQEGIRTASDFAKMMAALMSDLAESRITPQVGNAIVNAGGKLLKVAEMQARFGVQGKGAERELILVGGRTDEVGGEGKR